VSDCHVAPASVLLLMKGGLVLPLGVPTTAKHVVDVGHDTSPTFEVRT
jgi:hypothetical protein